MGRGKLFGLAGGLVAGLAAMPVVYAHCPLCTVGAAAAAGGAAWLGVSKAIIGVFIGAFAVSIGWWISRLIKRRFIPFQRLSLILFSFVTTVLPLMPLLGSQQPFFVSLMGDYGSWLNRTYMIDIFLVGTFLGGIVAYIAPWLSGKLSQVRGAHIPYQGIVLTLGLLALASVIIELVV